MRSCAFIAHCEQRDAPKLQVGCRKFGTSARRTSKFSSDSCLLCPCVARVPPLQGWGDHWATVYGCGRATLGHVGPGHLFLVLNNTQFLRVFGRPAGVTCANNCETAFAAVNPFIVIITLVFHVIPAVFGS